MRATATKAPGIVALTAAAALLALACRKAPESGPHAECTGDGIVSSRSVSRPGSGELAVEIVQSCEDCEAKRRPGAPAGSPCSAASVCAEQCCKCSKGRDNSFRARACDAARCLGEEACSAARRMIRPDVCAAEPSYGAAIGE